MRKKILIFSSGPAGKEVLFLINEINKKNPKQGWEVVGFVDKKKTKKKVKNLKVYDLNEVKDKKTLFAICPVNDPNLRKKIYEKEIIKNFKIPNLIHPDVNLQKKNIGVGNIIFRSVNFSYDISVGNYNIFNYNCAIGHDTKINNYNTLMPFVVIGGNCKIDKSVMMGTGVIINQNINVGSNSIIGTGTVVLENVKKNYSVVDFPRKIKRQNND